MKKVFFIIFLFGAINGMAQVKPGVKQFFDQITPSNPVQVKLDNEKSGFGLTFNLNMAGVTGFDRQRHKVFLSGSFTNPVWAEPGREGAVELVFNPALTNEHETFYFEGFENWSTVSPGVLPSGWVQKRTASINAVPTADASFPAWFLNNAASNPFEGSNPPNPEAWKTYVKTGQGSLVIGYDAADFTWAISPEIAIPDAGQVLLSYWKWYRHLPDSIWFTNYHVMIFADGVWNRLQSFFGIDGAAQNIFERAVEINLNAYSGKRVKLAFVYAYNDGYQMAIDDIKVSGIRIENVGKNLIFSATVPNVQSGLIEYKYFSDAFGAGFAGAEWAGNPMRKVLIDKTLTINDVWNQYIPDPSLNQQKINAEADLLVFPNPAKQTVFVRGSGHIDYLRLFDMAGKLIIKKQVSGFSTSIDVNHLQNGIYILQVITGKEVNSRKIQVVR